MDAVASALVRWLRCCWASWTPRWPVRALPFTNAILVIVNASHAWLEART